MPGRTACARRESGAKCFAEGKTLKRAGFAWPFEWNQRGPRKIKILRGDKFGFFAYYCWAVGALALLLAVF